MIQRSTTHARSLDRTIVTRVRLCDLLISDTPEVPAPSDWPDLVEYAHRGRVHLVLAARLRDLGLLHHCPPTIRRALERVLEEAALLERLRADDLRRILATLATTGISPVLFKGVPVGYLAYPQPHLRAVVDVDLLIASDHVDGVHLALAGAGLQRIALVDGHLVMHQFQYVTPAPSTLMPAYDFHERIANPEVFADLLSFEEAASTAVPVPALGPHARALSSVHALFVACVHRVAHHHDRDGDRLIWLYDIHLLASRLSRQQWLQFARLAEARTMRAVCGRGLASAAEAFGTIVPADIEALGSAQGEPSAFFVDKPLVHLDVQLSTFKHLPTWRARGQFVRQHLFPSPSHLLRVYQVRNRLWLPALYTHRLLRGAIRWLRPVLSRRT